MSRKRSRPQGPSKAVAPGAAISPTPKSSIAPSCSVIASEAKQSPWVVPLLCAALVVGILVVYGQLVRFEFIGYDDTAYVTDNPHTQAGLTWAGIVWAFTTNHACNWHPLAWLSHMLDVQLFGLNAGAHHAVNVLFHAANSVLLFLVLRGMTRALWPSLFVAALFALHPLHVESVAWISERKDVLSAFFWMLTMGGYVHYVRRPSAWRYLAVAGPFALGLLAKPMLVTLPAALMLLDYWPLRRLDPAEPDRKKLAAKALRLALEKLPLFALTVVSSSITFYAQSSGGGVVPMDVIPLWVRLMNTPVAYVRYILMMFWPPHLAVFYPHLRAAIPFWQPVAAVIALIVLSVLVLLCWRRAPYVLIGWLWYVGTLVPVIGIVQVGDQALADRYTYIPLIGIFIILAWGTAELAGRWKIPKAAVAATGGLALLLLGACAYAQVGTWRNTITLFEHALKVTTNNCRAHKALGVALADKEHRYDEAAEHCRKALQLDPNDSDLYYNYGNALLGAGKVDEAIEQYKISVRLDPAYINALYNLGNAYTRKQAYDDAIAAFRKVIELQPAHESALNNIGSSFVYQGHYEEAEASYAKVLAVNPRNLEAQCNLGYALSKQGKPDEARGAYEKALRIDPACKRAQDALRGMKANSTS